jgi:methionyl-tRNA synthetase
MKNDEFLSHGKYLRGMKSPARYTVTAALIYANGPIHIGHMAGCYLPADIFVRYLRANGKDVAFISGTDEHGVPITLKARKEGISPQEVVDHYYGMIKDTFHQFGISFDIYSRTSNALHHSISQDFFLHLYNKGVFIEEITEQYFDQEANTFLADRYITGTCPNCANPSAYGDQCEKCGTSLSPDELINPVSSLSGNTPIKKPTKNWSLPLDKMQVELENYIEKHPDWKPNVLGQVKSWLKQGLHSRAMTRDLSWGVSVPVEGAEGKVLYVWFDAPIGYITFTKEWADANNKSWEDYWKKDDTALIHFIGKDNIVFHTLIFPAMLQAHGDYILPEQVPAMEFMNLEGQKISTSRNWAVWVHEYLQDFPGKVDVMRYALTSGMPESKDNDFTWADFQARNNNELVAVLGNFVNRVLVLIHKYYQGKVPSFSAHYQLSDELINSINKTGEAIGKNIEQYRFRDALSELMNLARIGNKYLADTEPWKLIKTDPANTENILFTAIQIAAKLAVWMEPFLPFTSHKLSDMLQMEPVSWANAGNDILIHSGHQIAPPALLFDKIEDEQIAAQLQKLNESLPKITTQEIEKKTDTQMPETDFISIEDVKKVVLKIAEIKHAQAVKGANKLLQLTLLVDNAEKTVLSGIAQHHKPEEIIGKQVIWVSNLKPREMRGVLSEGMILMADGEDGKLVFVGPDSKVPNGSLVC